MQQTKARRGGKTAHIDSALAAEYKAKRIALGMTIESFWGSLGAAKSTGSRYENCQRTIPKTVRQLYAIRYGNQNALFSEKYGEKGRIFLEMLNNPDLNEIAWLVLLAKCKQAT